MQTISCSTNRILSDDLAAAKQWLVLLPVASRRQPGNARLLRHWPRTQVVASMDAAERVERTAHADEEMAARRPFEAADGWVQRLIAASEELLAVVLLAEGFYCHQRTWRRRKWNYVRRQSD